jgi:hypothetical protein
MKAAAHSEVPRATDRGRDHRGRPTPGDALNEPCSDERPSPPIPFGPPVPEERAAETFTDGAGI